MDDERVRWAVGRLTATGELVTAERVARILEADVDEVRAAMARLGSYVPSLREQHEGEVEREQEFETTWFPLDVFLRAVGQLKSLDGVEDADWLVYFTIEDEDEAGEWTFLHLDDVAVHWRTDFRVADPSDSYGWRSAGTMYASIRGYDSGLERHELSIYSYCNGTQVGVEAPTTEKVMRVLGFFLDAVSNGGAQRWPDSQSNSPQAGDA